MAEENAVACSVRESVAACEDAWWSGASTLPNLPRAYPRREQRARERELHLLVSRLLAELKRPPKTHSERAAVEARLSLAGRAFARSSLGVDDAHMDLLLQGGFTPCAREFARRAREFAPAIPFGDIIQASRNVWTVNGLQTMLGLPVRLTPSAFAYSMLYPLTDNLLDDPAVPDVDKARFNERFGRRIAGEWLAPESRHETDLWRLLAEIESEHGRADAPRVYESLLAIHAAQTRSVSLLCRDEPPYGVDVLGISLEKGGASVLADGYLVAGDLAPPDATLFFGLGALLQLADDLQDAEEDARCGTLTVFSQALGRWPLDRLVSRLLWFRAWVLEPFRPSDAPGARELGDLMRGASLQIVLGAVAESPRRFTARYVRALEAHSPFRFPALLRERRRLDARRVSLLGLAASALEDGEPAATPTRS